MKQKARGDLNGFLDSGSRIEGELHFEDTFRVDGRLNGKATSTGDLVVGENGVVEAEITVGSIFVSGTVRGTIKATERIEIAAGAKVLADLETPTLVVEDGATLEGYCKMSPQKSKPVTSQQDAVVARLPISKDR